MTGQKDIQPTHSSHKHWHAAQANAQNKACQRVCLLTQKQTYKQTN